MKLPVGSPLPWKRMCLVPITVPVELVSNQPNSLISVATADALRNKVAFNVCILAPDVIGVLVELALDLK